MNALTPREREALQFAADGYDSHAIAEELGYSLTASGAAHVRRLWKNAMDKLGADTTTQAVAMGLRRNVIR